MEERVTPEWIVRDNACVYVTLSRPTDRDQPTARMKFDRIPATHRRRDLRGDLQRHDDRRRCAGRALRGLHRRRVRDHRGAGYALHCLYTFSEQLSVRGFARYTAAMLLTLPFSLGGMYLLRDVAHAPMWLASPFLTALMFVWNYVATHWAVVTHAFTRKKAPGRVRARDFTASIATPRPGLWARGRVRFGMRLAAGTDYRRHRPGRRLSGELLLEQGYEVFGLVRRSSHLGIVDAPVALARIVDRVKLVDGNMADLPSLLRIVERISRTRSTTSRRSRSSRPPGTSRPHRPGHRPRRGQHAGGAAHRAARRRASIRRRRRRCSGWSRQPTQNETTPFHPRSPYAVGQALRAIG